MSLAKELNTECLIVRVRIFRTVIPKSFNVQEVPSGRKELRFNFEMDLVVRVDYRFEPLIRKHYFA